MTLFAYLAGSDVGHKVRLNAIGVTNNADGTVGFGSIVFDDADGSLTVRGWMKVVVKETACTSAPVIFSGYVGPRTYSRNQYRSGAARFIDTTLVDENAVLHCRLITGSDGKRPAETHNARINWLLASSYMSGLISDTSLIDTSNPRPFEEADYRGQYADDVLNDIAGPIFRTFFVYPTQPNGTRGLFFDTPTAVVGTSTLTISNVLSDISATCFPPSIDAVLSRDPSEVYSRIRYTYANGTIIENDTSAVTDFFTDNGLLTRGLQVNNSRVGLASTARSMAQRLLERADGEGDTITVTVVLPAASVGLIDAGQRIRVRFTHLPGYETLTYTRVTSRNIRQSEGTNEYYDVTLELNTHGLSSAGGAGAPAPGGFPHQATPPSIVQQSAGRGSRTMPSSITAGDTLVYVGSCRGGAFPNLAGLGYTEVRAQVVNGGGDGVGMFYKLAGAAESTTLTFPALDVAGCWFQLPGTWTPDTSASTTGSTVNLAVGPITVATNAFTVTVAGQGRGGAYDSEAGLGVLSFTPGSGWTEDLDDHVTSGHPSVFVGHRFDSGSITGNATNSGSGSLSGTDYDWGMQIASFIGATSNEPPSPGQVVPWTVVTMAGAVGTTAYPYADGSLLVKVDGLLISPASYTETDPAAGTFTLDWIPATDEVVTCQYLGR